MGAQEDVIEVGGGRRIGVSWVQMVFCLLILDFSNAVIAKAL